MCLRGWRKTKTKTGNVSLKDTHDVSGNYGNNTVCGGREGDDTMKAKSASTLKGGKNSLTSLEQLSFYLFNP